MKKYICLILVILTSCNNAQRERRLDKSRTEVNSIDMPFVDTNTFEYKLANSPKVFLKYWSGMTYKDFFAVSNILKDEGVLESNYGLEYYFILDNEKIKIDLYDLQNPYNKDEGKVYSSIILSELSKSNYNAFKTKYDLPELANGRILSKVKIEENPLYRGGVEESFLPSHKVFETFYGNRIDHNYYTIKNLSKNFYVEGTTWVFEMITEPLLPIDEIVFEKGDNIVLFKNNVSNKITTAPLVHAYENNMKLNSSDRDLIKYYSQKRITLLGRRFDFGVIYTSKETYNAYNAYINKNESKREIDAIKEKEKALKSFDNI